MPDRSWFERHPLEVAFDLLGMAVAVERDGTRTSGRIVEVEAYGGMSDPASHASFLKAGKENLYDEAGRLYMYRSYGIHTMLNVVAHEPGVAGAILIRALEPLSGIPVMQERRKTETLRSLTTGPGVLCQALGLRLTDNRYDLVEGTTIQLLPGSPPDQVVAGPRIGITKAVDHPWRLFEAGSQFVSSHRRGTVVDRLSLVVDIESWVEAK
jgi:DNA-3-methyladenine glycosylase